ncbi:Protein EFR3 [Erysiphe neolycopersici]|uniref:Protein EFR3 n=1 Tax=Erysiphe neolycopersici TaxID=212602 RepID=A0A420HKC6_9PEZI|nr:Protein EFR3 [Erysiphe neolycopersici]
MHAIRQKCRPKHQVLILNCYPRTVKGAVDVKPNSSELSYLLYYATTRRSKVQKVGAFLEKKTASDVWRARIGNVQVTLQIVAGLIEKAPRDLPLYATHVLKLLNIILSAHDITMVESSLLTFESFCQNHDEASLSADQEYLCQYENIVSKYASLALENPSITNPTLSTPVALRWKNLGLQAIKSVFSSEALASIAGRLLNLIVPILLDTIWSENSDYINLLEQKTKVEVKFRTRSFSRRRASIATIHTVETSSSSKAALSGTTADADKVAEEDNTVLSLECLRLIFAVNNKAQIHGATLATLKYIGDFSIKQKNNLLPTESRAIQIFQMISRWAPVQDRYTILVTTLDLLVNSSIDIDIDDFQKQLLYATMIDSLLKSDINLIGLGVLDVLIGLIRHLLRVLQSSRPPSQEANTICEVSTTSDGQWPLKNTTEAHIEALPKPILRKKLLEKLQDCIGNLATHIYYADQISDMVSALICRIKLRSSTNLQHLASTIESSTFVTSRSNPTGDLEEINSEGLFLFANARVSVLKAINSILLTASLRKSLSVIGNLARNYVSTRVWEGTHWLLCDNDNDVRKAYVAALLTWMKYEMSEYAPRMSDSKPIIPSRTIKVGTNINSNMRSISNTWPREKPTTKRQHQSAFLDLLHLTIYENALKYSEREEEIIILYILLHGLVDNLGISAVRHGLPMIFRLQYDISEQISPLAKIHISSLCYGYFWILCEKFKLNTTPVDIEIQCEIHRRQKNQLWLNEIRYPPPCLDQIRTPEQQDPSQTILLESLHPDSLKPFTERLRMVELIFLSYSEGLMVQGINSPTSPSRTCTQPILDSSKPHIEFETSEDLKEQLISEWSSETVAAQQSIKPESLSGSRTGTSTLRHRNYLSIGGNDRSYSPPAYNQSSRGYKSESRSSSNNGPKVGLGSLKKTRRTSELSPSTTGGSRQNSITRVEYLKRILSGQEQKVSRSRIIENMTPSNASSESMLSYAYTTSEISFNPSQSNLSQLEFSASDREPNKLAESKSHDEESRHNAPLSSNPVLVDERFGFLSDSKEIDTVPPIPSIPRLYKDELTAESELALEDNDSICEKRGTRSQIQLLSKESPVALENFLKEIDVGSERATGYVTKPPY